MARIGIDVRLTRYRQGGISEYMTQLVAALAPHHDYHLLHHFRAHKNLADHLRRINCYTPCHHRFEAWALGLELLPHRLDLLHSPDFIPPRFGAKRYVITVHDLAFLLYAGIQTPESLAYYAGQIRRAVRQADHIIAVSHATKQDIMTLLEVPSEKISVTWEGLHPQFRVLENLPSPPYSLPDDYILFVGTIEPRKNLPILLKGYAILKERLKNPPKLVLAGAEGWLAEATFQAIIDLRLSDEVVWLDSVPFGDLPLLYNRAKIHILASLYEGFGFPPLEAMACGTPSIVSERGALREVAGEAALYVDPDDPASIADQLQKLLLDEALQHALRQKGLAHARQFTWAQTAAQTLAIYDQVLAQ